MRVAFVLLFTLVIGTGASAAGLKLLASDAYKPAAQDIVATFEKSTGHKVAVEADSADALQKRITGGEYFDVVVLPTLVLAPFLGNRVDESSAKALARASIGVGIREGAAVPDISDTDSFRKTLLAARTIAYTDPVAADSSGAYLATLFRKLGISAEIKSRSVLVPGGAAASRVASGEAEIALQQSSEIIGAPGVRFVGPIPLELQNDTLYSGGVSVGSRNRAAADALLLALGDPRNARILKEKGMQGP